MSSGTDQVVWSDAHDGFSVSVPCVPSSRKWKMKIEPQEVTLKVGDFLHFPSGLQRAIVPSPNFTSLLIVTWFGGRRGRTKSMCDRLQAITSLKAEAWAYWARKNVDELATHTPVVDKLVEKVWTKPGFQVYPGKWTVCNSPTKDHVRFQVTIKGLQQRTSKGLSSRNSQAIGK